MIASYLMQVLEAWKRSMFKLLRSVVSGCMPKRNTEQTALDDYSDYLLFTCTLPVVSAKTNDRFLLNAGLGSTEALYV
jgi:hypothetical protein